MISEIIDPNYTTMQGCGRLAGLMLKTLADSIILPFNLKDYPQKMKESLQSFKKKEMDSKIKSFYPKYGM